MALNADAAIGRVVAGRYEIKKLLGRGGMGAVYEAERVGLGKRVAVKFLVGEQNPDLVARFHREARVASKIEHPHVVQIFDVGTDEGDEFIVMELVDGGDLRRVLADGPLPLERALAIGKQILHGLHAIHEAGIIHRDIKPANIVLVDRGDLGVHAKIMDFGISKLVAGSGPALTKAGHVVGTPQYMAPELLTGGDADRRSDLYAVALTLYELIAGRSPFAGGDTAQITAQHLTETPAPLDEIVPGVPARVARAIDRALAKDPTARFGTALAFANALDGRVSAVTAATKVDRPPPPPPPPRSHRFVYVIAALMIIAVPLGVFLATRNPAAPAATAAVIVDAAIAVDDSLAEARAAEQRGDKDAAIVGYRRYLATAPIGDDVAAIRARIAALEPPPPPPLDAGIEAASTPVPRRPAAPRTSKPSGTYNCRCATDTDDLCTKAHAPMCRCELPGNMPLCADRPPLGRTCQDGYTASNAMSGVACDGYHFSTGGKIRGAFRCSQCAQPSIFVGRPGDACVGYDRRGQQRTGELRGCATL